MTSSKATFKRYLVALQSRDHATLRELTHPGFEDFYPQSGERTRGIENLISIIENYPGGVEPLGQDRIVGGSDEFVRTPSFVVVRIEGSGDQVMGVQRARYPDGATWYIIVVAELREGLVYRTDSFFAPSFPPAEWRAPWVELEPARIDTAPVGQTR
jgi:hypothetical protein